MRFLSKAILSSQLWEMISAKVFPIIGGDESVNDVLASMTNRAIDFADPKASPAKYYVRSGKVEDDERNKSSSSKSSSIDPEGKKKKKKLKKGDARSLSDEGCKRRKKNRIIGGRTANVGRYSYAVSLQNDDGQFCGGSLIAPDIVLSAAHCQGLPYKIAIGRHHLKDSNGEEIEVTEEIPHPEYDADTTDNDFMIIVLKCPITVDVELVKLNSDPSEPQVGDPVTVMGWGDTVAADNITKVSDELMHVEVKVISNKECEESEGHIDDKVPDNYHGQITSAMLCAENDNQDSCQGDSGGPLVILGSEANGAADVQVGVVSWGVGCAHETFPGVYARVSSQYDWIKDEVCKNSVVRPPRFKCDITSSAAFLSQSSVGDTE